MANRFARPDNFASPLRTPLLREHYVYRAFSEMGELLYIGCSKNLEARMRDHRMSGDWYHLTVRLTAAGPYNWETARQIERDAIQTERALYNNQTPERVAVIAAHQRIQKRRLRALVAGGMTFWEAVDEAMAHAERVLPDPSGRGPYQATDLSIPHALRVDREDAESYESGAA